VDAQCDKLANVVGRTSTIAIIVNFLFKLHHIHLLWICCSTSCISLRVSSTDISRLAIYRPCMHLCSTKLMTHCDERRGGVKSRVLDKVPEGSNLTFEIQYPKCATRLNKRISSRAKAKRNLSNCFERTPTCDRHRQTPDDSYNTRI